MHHRVVSGTSPSWIVRVGGEISTAKIQWVGREMGLKHVLTRADGIMGRSRDRPAEIPLFGCRRDVEEHRLREKGRRSKHSTC